MRRHQQLIDQLRSGYDDLRPSEQRVADLLMSDPGAFGKMSPLEIAVEANVSEATISRVCKAFGLRGLRELRERIAEGGE